MLSPRSWAEDYWGASPEWTDAPKKRDGNGEEDSPLELCDCRDWYDYACFDAPALEREISATRWLLSCLNQAIRLWIRSCRAGSFRDEADRLDFKLNCAKTARRERNGYIRKLRDMRRALEYVKANGCLEP